VRRCVSVDSRSASRGASLRDLCGVIAGCTVSCVARRVVATDLSAYLRRVFMKKDKGQSIVCIYNGIISYLSVDFSFFHFRTPLLWVLGWWFWLALRFPVTKHQGGSISRKNAHRTLTSYDITHLQ